VDAFASSAPDEVVLVNKSTAASRVLVHVQTDSPKTATVWQIHQGGVTPSPPAKIATLSSVVGAFKVTLPADSVTTIIVTTKVSNRG